MLSDFHGLLDQFCQQRGLSWQQSGESWQAVLEVEGLALNLGYMEERGVFFIQTAVGFLPEDMASQHAVMLKILKANNGFSATGGATLGYDEDVDCITLQLAWPLENLNGEQFSNVLENTIITAAQIMQDLAQPIEPSASDANFVGSANEESNLQALLSAGLALRI